MNNFQSFKIKDDILYLYFSSDTEFSKFNDNNSTLKTFIKKINFKGKYVKIVISGIVLATIPIVANINSTESDKTIIEDEFNDSVNDDESNDIIPDVGDESNDNDQIIESIPDEINLNLTIHKMFLNNDSQKIHDMVNLEYIIIHNTANNASSENEIKYLNSSMNKSTTSYHYAVDESEIWQGIPDEKAAYHAGNYYYNSRSIGIEIARSTHIDTTIRDDSIINGAKLTASLLNKYNLGINKVKRHYDSDGKWCPHDIIDRYGWNEYLELVKSYMN